jgi:adenylate kinase
MRILFAGPPCVGKSRVSSIVASRLGVPRISSGELIRRAAIDGSPEEKELARIVSDGTLAPSDVIVDMMLKRLSEADCDQGFVIDGFPRKDFEASRFLCEHPRIDAYLLFSAPRETLLRRMRSRFSKDGTKREDDTAESLRYRLSIYDEEAPRVVNLFRSFDVPVLDIDASHHVGDVAESVLDSLGATLDEDLLPLAC